MLNLRDASCWSVDVMNGGAGFFFFSVFLMLSTRNSPVFSSSRMASTVSRFGSSRFFGSP